VRDSINSLAKRITSYAHKNATIFGEEVMVGIILAVVGLLGCAVLYVFSWFVGWFTGWWDYKQAAEPVAKVAEFVVDIALQAGE
jgi:multisubunit Na+/H+ antiporter MnhB subunit